MERNMDNNNANNSNDEILEDGDKNNADSDNDMKASDSRQTYICSNMSNYSEDWEEEDIIMKSPSSKNSLHHINAPEITKSITTLEPLDNYKGKNGKGRAMHQISSRNHQLFGDLKISRPILPPISVSNLPSSCDKQKRVINIGDNVKSDPADCYPPNNVPSEGIRHSKGGLAFAIGLNENEVLKPKKPPHFLPSLGNGTRAMNSGSFRNMYEERQRIAEVRHEKHIQNIAEKARANSAKRKRAAGKLREQLRQSKEVMEDKLRTKLNLFEEKKNLIMREKLIKLKMMREREEKARRRLEKQRLLIAKEEHLVEEMQSDTSRPDSKPRFQFTNRS